MSTFKSSGKIKIDGKLYNLLSQGENGQVVVINNKEVAKIFELSESREEANLMKTANSINSLVVKLLRVDITSGYSNELLVMERLYPLQYRAISVPERERFFKVFLTQLKELHLNGWAHGDIKRPDWVDSPWDNIILTQIGIRLIDTGTAVTSNHYKFKDWCMRDIANAMEFKDVFLKP
jgi:serine/threonine protein kinase